MKNKLNFLVNELTQYGEVLTDVSLKKMTTLRIGGNAKIVVYPKTLLALTQILREIKEAEVPFKVLGKGSNILCSDNDYEGVIIRLDRTFTDFYFDHDQLYAEAGCSIISLAYEAMKNGLSGLEFASGIPGTVGGTTFMNAGAYKMNMADIVEEVFVLRDGQLEWLSKEECQFSYRSSVFSSHPDWIIVAVRIHLEKKDAEEIRSLIEQRRERRLNAQPLEFPSAGSVFRNPENKAAWELIDQIGYRGKRIGDACVSEKHVNFIVNLGDAKASDYLALIEQIQQKVNEEFDEELIMEVEKFNW